MPRLVIRVKLKHAHLPTCVSMFKESPLEDETKNGDDDPPPEGDASTYFDGNDDDEIDHERAVRIPLHTLERCDVCLESASWNVALKSTCDVTHPRYP